MPVTALRGSPVGLCRNSHGPSRGAESHKALASVRMVIYSDHSMTQVDVLEAKARFRS